MVSGPIVAVRGEAFREVPPEIARFAVTVEARDKDRQTTLRQLADRAERVRSLIDSYDTAIERRETGGLSVYPERKKSGEKVTAYRGSVATTVTVADFAVLGELMLRLADQDQATVAGPWWELRRTSPLHRELRREAIGEAIALAREYADALGAHITALVEVADSGMRAQPMMVQQAYGSDFSMKRGGAPSIDLDPQLQSVQAVVEARFVISEPSVLGGPAQT